MRSPGLPLGIYTNHWHRTVNQAQSGKLGESCEEFEEGGRCPRAGSRSPVRAGAPVGHPLHMAHPQRVHGGGLPVIVPRFGSPSHGPGRSPRLKPLQTAHDYHRRAPDTSHATPTGRSLLRRRSVEPEGSNGADPALPGKGSDGKEKNTKRRPAPDFAQAVPTGRSLMRVRSDQCE